MAAQKLKSKSLEICPKCSSVMITRIIAEKNGSGKSLAKMVKILQCAVCRHWIALE